MVQEFNAGSNSTGELRAFVDSAFGPEYTFTRALASGRSPTASSPAIRFSPAASGPTPRWPTATSSGRRSTSPSPIDLYAISVHLLGSGAGARDLEAGELVQHIQGFPAGAYVVLGGDFNTSTRIEPCVQTLSSVLITAGPFPVDQANLDTTNTNRNKPYDWVLVNGPLASHEQSVAIGGNMFAHGLVVDTRVYSPIVGSGAGARGRQRRHQHAAHGRGARLRAARPAVRATDPFAYFGACIVSVPEVVALAERRRRCGAGSRRRA